ncbi:PH and SEC7 domain-containing protein isoform X1 [Folsomia candida]|uniref:PH and SEC7 domain-containing protein isoform X1 n=1 Tax=Folsomia candida TaxID=158441 RepID=UPI001604B762|nr:PH and SEC7 domain-containing protein isoform X1 [Folsomia candida]XP_035714779.1 PH and SEC7 domain-containing protein isoform X1 [Folsomia candida]XP_035714780.1 PH and SEC7 domain-containing protein isoform X1 [Folsomia candida]XP_035714781.1 PH and SEC7 domain-containing protein isoform X1 [Folsomia candida]XP_035714782.1 PH and SEC7 domain-containing protein isoform X1 [Folsomia candida]XP_035714783.1 PH and SEC7 domain-containing protein isoform X1 [Folsomia candida]XP_035714784.1 PH
MTGDAILSKDLSKNEANPLLSSPRKPVVVRTITDVVMPRKEETTCLVDKSESDDTPTPPTFPPPPSELNNSYNSDEAKLPPPPVEVTQQQQKNGGCGKCHDKKKTNGVTKKTFYPNYRDDVEDEEEENYSGNNTEDTSISSSVMSDDDDDEAICRDQIYPGCEEDVVVAEVDATGTTSPVAGCSKNLMGNGNGNYYNGIKTGPIAASTTGVQMTREDSYDGGGGVEKSGGGGIATASFEKERYAEYILVNESDFSPRHGPTTNATTPGGPHHSNSYSQAINSKATPPTKHQNSLPRDPSSSFHEEDEDLSSSSTTTSTNSENDPFQSSQQEGGPSSARHNTDSISGGESDSSDVESVCVPPVTKAVDVPSAIRLGKRLWALDGFRSGDVWRHLCKNTEYNRIVAIEYLSNFNFTGETVDVALRKFLATCPLKGVLENCVTLGETQERERVLSYFALRYLENNPGLQFSSPDAVHTITCAIMLLNTDLYAGANKERMTCPQFIENLSGLNDGKNFNKETLKLLYISVRKKPLVSPGDIDDAVVNPANRGARMGLEDQAAASASVTDLTKSMDYRTGYLMRKSTHELGGKKTPFGKRSWKIFFCRLKELVLLLLADEGNCSVPTYQIKLHHAFASPASDYRKRKNVLRLVLADSSQFLLQASDPRELTSWVELLNWNSARFSAPALEAPISSTGRFQKPLLPSCITALCRDEQVATHLRAQQHWEKQLGFYTPPVKEVPPPKKGKGKVSSSSDQPAGASSLPPPPPPPFSSTSTSNPPFPPLLLLSYAHVKKEDREKVLFFQSEILRYHTYLTLLEKLGQSDPHVGQDNQQQAPSSPPPPVDLNRLPNNIPPIILHEEEDDD